MGGLRFPRCVRYKLLDDLLDLPDRRSCHFGPSMCRAERAERQRWACPVVQYSQAFTGILQMSEASIGRTARTIPPAVRLCKSMYDIHPAYSRVDTRERDSSDTAETGEITLGLTRRARNAADSNIHSNQHVWRFWRCLFSAVRRDREAGIDSSALRAKRRLIGHPGAWM
jgi:hypothetical protein